MSRKTKLGLAGLVLALAASLSLSSVAWSSPIRVTTQAAAPRVSQQQIRRAVKQDAGKLRAAICRGPNRGGLPCGDGKSPQSVKPRISHFDLSDPACPVWWIDRPRAIFATVATNAAAVCVSAVSGHDITGAPFSASQDPEIAVLNLWNYTGGRWIQEGHTSSDFGNCSVIPVNISIWPLVVDHVKLCSASGLSVHARVFPPAGTYKGKLTVITLSPFWTGATMLDAGGEHFCYFC